MIRFLADENFNADIVRGLVRRVGNVDVVRVQDAGLRGADDEAVLAEAARDQRVVLTHDVATLIARAWDRVREGKLQTGVIVVPQALAVGADSKGGDSPLGVIAGGTVVA